MPAQDTKITALAAIGANPINVATFPIPMVDLLDNSMAASGTTKKVTVNQILGAGGTATLASATISGDLTVDTSTLKVDSANDRVGFGTASPAQFVHLSKSNTSTALTSPPVGGASLRIQNSSSTNNNFGSVEFYNAAGLFGASVNCQYTNQATPTNDLVFVTRGSSGGLEHYRIAADGVATWSEVGGTSGTAMTLNSTGLGVGVGPSYKLDVTDNSTNIQARLNSSNNNGTSLRFVNTGTSGRTWQIGTGFAVTAGNFEIYDATAAVNRLSIDSSGNVGIGVTPSYKLDTQVAGGADRSILRAAVIGVSGGFQVKWDNATSKIHAIIENIPTSSAGLPSGTLWSDSGTIKIA